jgi:hypothetical protein
MSSKWQVLFGEAQPPPEPKPGIEITVQAPCSFCRKYFDIGLLTKKGQKQACRGCLPRLVKKYPIRNR